MNEIYLTTLEELLPILNSESYIVVGSLALLSYTQSNGYDRQIHDIDLIIGTSVASVLENRLRTLGYEQHTFIDKRMPFYNKLIQYAQSKYLRFTRGDVAIEILVTPFEKKNDAVILELYPKIKVCIPNNAFVQSSYKNVTFRTLSKEMIYFIKKVANNTFGKKVKYKSEQRNTDIEEILKLIDIEKLNVVANRSRINVLGVPVRIPSLFMK